MGVEAEKKEHETQQPRLVPYIQVIAIIAVGVLAAYDLSVESADVPVIVYAIIAAIAVGVAPETLLPGWGRDKK